MSFAKALATKYPRGVNIVAEADFFYPLPTKITDWYPATKKPPAVSSPKVDHDVDDAAIQYVPLLAVPEPSASYSLVFTTEPIIRKIALALKSCGGHIITTFVSNIN